MTPDRERAYLGIVPAEPEDSRFANQLYPCRVLIVDDDDMVRGRLAALLRASNYEIELAASGEEALRVMSTQHCHIVLTDWVMPDMDGLALCRCIRVSQQDGYIYVMMLSVRESKDDMLMGLAAGADDYVVKGSSINEILARLEVGRRIVYLERSLRASKANRHLVFTDSLSGTHNLNYFIKQLSNELARSQRYQHPLAVLTCEIERFERMRDHLGYDTVAEILQAFAARTEQCVRASSDWIARVGAGEFMIVLPETGAAGAHRVAQKLHDLFAADPVTTRAGPITLKVGIAVTAMDAHKRPEGAARIEELIRTARRGFNARREISRAEMRAAAPVNVSEFDRRSRGNRGLN